MHGLRCTYCYSASDPPARWCLLEQGGPRAPEGSGLGTPAHPRLLPRAALRKGACVGTCWGPPEEAGHSCEGGCSPGLALPSPPGQALGLFPWWMNAAGQVNVEQCGISVAGVVVPHAVHWQEQGLPGHTQTDIPKTSRPSPPHVLLEIV